MIHVYRIDPEGKKIWYSHSSEEDSLKCSWFSGIPIYADNALEVCGLIESANYKNRWLISRELIKYKGEDGHIVDDRIPIKYRTP